MPLLAGIGPFGLPELLLIAFIVVLVFGVGRLPEVGGAVGRGIREFRKATKEEDQETTTAKSTSGPADAAPAPPPSAGVDGGTVFCGECGSSNPRTAKFCANCGHALGAPVA